MNSFDVSSIIGRKITRQSVLGYFGTTKGGKTTGICALTKIPEKIIELSSGDSGRTKTTVQYHIVPNEFLKDIVIEKIEVFEQNIAGSVTGDVDKYNEQLKKNVVLRNVLGLKQLGKDEGVKEHIAETINSFKYAKVSTDNLKKLLCSENVDKYIRRITLIVPAEQNIAKYLLDNELDLFIRDTRGLLDIALEDKNVKNEQKSRTLKELGLEGLDGVVFFCSESYPNIIQEIYYDTFKSVFESVPVFLMARDNMLFNIFSVNKQPITYSNVENAIDAIQEGKNPFYNQMEEQYFLNTFALMSKFGITCYDSEKGKYKFKDTYFNQQKVEFLLPSCVSLKMLFVNEKENISKCIKEKDFLFYQVISVVACIKMLTMINHLQQGMLEVIKTGVASKHLWDVCIEPENIKTLEKDFSRYDNYHTSFLATDCVKPQFTFISKKRIEQDIIDKTVELLGVRGGITTKNNGRLRYPTTAVIAVTSRQWISVLIRKIKLKGNIVNSNKELFPELHDNINSQEALLQKALYYILYKKFTDEDATIQYYLLVNRNNAVSGIILRRNKCCTNYNEFVEVIMNVVKAFCNEVSNTIDISGIYRNTEN